jgi:hypothetical protein
MQDSGMLRHVHGSFHTDPTKESNVAMTKAGGLEPPSAFALLCAIVIRLASMIVLTGVRSVWMVLTWRNMLSKTTGHHHF